MQYRNYSIIAVTIAVISGFIIRLVFGWSLYTTWLVAVSIATFTLYGLDKTNARLQGSRAKHRVPKRLLHMLALLGGFVGGWLGMFIFWHKVRHPIFWTILIFSTVVHSSLWLFIF